MDKQINNFFKGKGHIILMIKTSIIILTNNMNTIVYALLNAEKVLPVIESRIR